MVLLPRLVIPGDHKIRQDNENFTYYSDFVFHYHEHCNSLVNLVEKEIEDIEKELLHFYGNMTHLRTLLENDEFAEVLFNYDTIVYQTMLNILIPNIMENQNNSNQNLNSDNINAEKDAHIRNFSRKFRTLIENSIKDFPSNFQIQKNCVARKFCNRLYSHSSIYSLSSVFQQILRTPMLITQMINDYNNTDFTFLNDKASTLLNVNTDIIKPFFSIQIPEALRDNLPVLKWLESFGEILRKFYEAENEKAKLSSTTNNTTSSSPSFSHIISIFSTYLSVIMNDLTVRNAESFGSFHIMRTLLEEYVLFFFDRIDEYSSFENPLPRGVSIHLEEPEEPIQKQFVSYQWNSSNLDDSDNSSASNNYPSDEFVKFWKIYFY